MVINLVDVILINPGVYGASLFDNKIAAAFSYFNLISLVIKVIFICNICNIDFFNDYECSNDMLPSFV